MSVSVSTSPPADAALAPRARAFLGATAAAAVVAALAPLPWAAPTARELLGFAALGAAAAVTQLFLLEVRANHGFATATVFLLAGALLLPPELVAPLALVQHLPDLVRRRTPVAIQLFNVSNYALDAVAAWAAWRVGSELGWTTGAGAAIVVFVLLNHLLLATMLRLARGHSFRATRLFSADGLAIEAVLACLGVAAAALVRGDTPVVVVAAVVPLLLVHRLLVALAAANASRPA